MHILEKTNLPLSDRLLELRFAEKNTDFASLFSARSADFSRMSGDWPALHGGFSRRNSTRTSKSDSLLGFDLKDAMKPQQFDDGLHLRAHA